MPGQDYEITAHLSIEEAARGVEIEVPLTATEWMSEGQLRRTTKTVKVRIPKGATDGQRLRVPGKGGPGHGGAPNGDLYVNCSCGRTRCFVSAATICTSSCPSRPGKLRWGPKFKYRRSTGASA